MNTEEWRPVPLFADYMISNTGQLQRDGRILRPDIDTRGRARYPLCVGGKLFKRFRCVLMLQAFVGPCPDGLECCHGPLGSLVDTLDNLRWDTRESNCADKIRAGTQPHGDRIFTTKLNPEAIQEIRRLRSEGVTLRALSMQFNVTQANLSCICLRKTWKYIH